MDFANISERGDSAEIQRTAEAFLETFEELGQTITDLDAEQARLTASVLEARPGDAEAVYWVQVLDIQKEIQPALEDVFAALGNIVSDPERGLELMAEAVARVGEANDRWADIDAPSTLEDLHRRQVESIAEFARVFNGFVDSVRRAETPSMATLIEMQSLAAETQTLNAERSRAIADLLRRIAR